MPTPEEIKQMSYLSDQILQFVDEDMTKWLSRGDLQAVAESIVLQAYQLGKKN